MESGYIKVSRRMADLDIWDNGYDAALYFYMLLHASHNRYQKLRPGQLYASIQGLAKQLGWTRNCVRKHLGRLKRMGLIAGGEEPDTVIYTITGWQDIREGKPHPATEQLRKKPDYEADDEDDED